jgi:MFS family permease
VTRRREVPTIIGTFVAFGSLFFDRLAPLYLIVVVGAELPIPAGAEGTLALLLGLGWAASMGVARVTSGRWSDRRRILVAAGCAAAFGAASAFAHSWGTFILLRGLGALAAGSAAPPVTGLSFAAAPPHRRGFDLGLVQSSTRVFGSFVSPVVVTAIAVVAGWRAALAVSSALVVLGAGVLALLVPAGASEDPPPSRGSPAALRLHEGGRRNIILCTGVAAVLLAWLFTVSQSGVPLLRDWLGVGTAEAGRILGLFGVGAAVAALAVPTLSDVTGRRAALAGAALVGSFGGLGVAVAAATGTGMSAYLAGGLFFLGGVALGGLPLAISIIPAEAVARGDVGRGVAAPVVGAEVVGGGMLPAFAGLAAQPLGLPPVLGMAAVLLIGVTGLSAALRPLSATKGRRRPPEPG